MGQWEDEAARHAPGLTVKTFHSSRKKKASETIFLDNRESILALNDIDVIISTSTFSWPSGVTDCCDGIFLPFEFR